MKKLIFLFLSLISISAYSQAVFDEGVQITGGQPTETSSTHITTTTADGTQGKILGENISLSVVPPVIHFTPVTPNIKGYFQGVDNAIGNIVTTTAGTTARVFFTGVVTPVNAVNYYGSSLAGKGAVSSVNQTVANNDNIRTYFAQDVISAAQAATTISAAGTYSGQLTVRVSDDAAQEKYGFEVYKTNNLGVPIASGIAGAPVGSLGVTVVAILDSGVIDLVQNSTTNVSVQGALLAPLTLNTGERIRYHVFAEKVGTVGASFTYTVYYGSDHSSHYDVPVTPTTDGVLNKSTVTGLTSTDALNTLNAAIPVNYSKIVYVNATNPNSATIFDLNNPPTVNDNALKTDVANLYVGTDASGWVYNSTSLNYVTKTVTSATSNFYLLGTTTDAGNSKTAYLMRPGGVSIGGNSPAPTKLYVESSSATEQSLVLKNTNATFQTIQQINNSSGSAALTFGINNPSYVTDATYGDAGDTFVRGSNFTNNLNISNTSTNTASGISFRTGTSGAERMFVGYDGNIGVRNRLPSTAFEVTGVISVGNTVGAGNLGLQIGGMFTETTMPTQVRGVFTTLNSGATVQAGSIGYQPRTGVGASHNFFTEQVERLRIASTGVVTISNLSGTGTRQVVVSSTGVLSAGTAQPLKYVALISQSGTSAPTVTILENTLGGTPVFTYTATGTYTATLSGAFPPTKTTSIISQLGVPVSGYPVRASSSSTSGNTVVINTILTDSSHTPINDSLANNMLEIRVYP